ncbi:MAG: FAD-dependent oxidoreductase, partial [Acidimicrobiales bacterium]
PPAPARPRRVLVVGAGFTGSEVAWACRQRGLDVTVVERGPGPLAGALGALGAEVAGRLQRNAGVDLRTSSEVVALSGDRGGRLRAATLGDGTELEVDVAVIALGAIRNTEWLAGAELAAGPLGVATDTGGRVFGINGVVTDDLFAAGDVARYPHPLFDFQFLSFEHWANAVVGGRVVGANMVRQDQDRQAQLAVPTFWSLQFGVTIKTVGVPGLGDEVCVVQGDPAEHRFAAAYTAGGRIVGAVTFDHGRWLQRYRDLVAERAPLPPPAPSAAGQVPAPAGFDHPEGLSHMPDIVITGHDPVHHAVVRRDLP